MSPDHPWNSLEIVKLAAEVLTPVSVAAFGWLVSHRLKQLELVQWTNQKLIEKRLALYDTIAPLLNRLLCFYTWVGPWKDISPDDVIRAKRELDQTRRSTSIATCSTTTSIAPIRRISTRCSTRIPARAGTRGSNRRSRAPTATASATARIVGIPRGPSASRTRTSRRETK